VFQTLGLRAVQAGAHARLGCRDLASNRGMVILCHRLTGPKSLVASFMRRVALSRRETRKKKRASGVGGNRNLVRGHLPVNPKLQPVPKRGGSCSWDTALSFELPIRSRKYPGIATSDMTRSGDSERAAASASSEQLKNLAEKPFIRNIAARLDAMTGSMCEYERGDTWDLFPACTS
jgi:hypothetical protein